MGKTQTKGSRSVRPGPVTFYAWSVGRHRRRIVGLLVLAFLALGAWRFLDGAELIPQRTLPAASPGEALREEHVAGDETPSPAQIAAEGDDAVPALGGVVVSVQADATRPPRRMHSFDELRLDRERQRSREMESLQWIVDDPARSQEERTAASRRLASMWTASSREAELEHLLEAQGYRVVVNLSEERAHIVVDAELDAAAAARIGELAVQVAEVGREAVTIVDAISSGR